MPNDSNARSLIKDGNPCRVSFNDGLYLRVMKKDKAFWIFRYTYNKKRKQMSIGRYGKEPKGMPLKKARERVYELINMVQEGIDPIVDKKREKQAKYNTVTDVANDWLDQISKHLENPHIPRRVYTKDIAPVLGDIPIVDVNSVDVLGVLRNINESGRPTIANDALTYLKQLFNHAIKLGMINNNPALAFTSKDAGGKEKSRNRALSLDELEIVFNVLKEQHQHFTRENLLAVALLLVLAVRKGELIATKWSELDLKNKVWTLPKERTKTRAEIRIPLPDPCITWFEELYIRACGSEYVFPSRRASKRRGYISDDTLNHALAKMFGQKVDANKKPYPNILGKAGIDTFVVHDLRRTARTLLAKNKVPSHIAERCLNHKLKGVEGIYDQYDYFNERQEALSQLAQQIAPLM